MRKDNYTVYEPPTARSENSEYKKVCDCDRYNPYGTEKKVHQYYGVDVVHNYHGFLTDKDGKVNGHVMARNYKPFGY